MALLDTRGSDVAPHQEASAAETLYNQRFAARSAPYGRPGLGSGSKQAPSADQGDDASGEAVAQEDAGGAEKQAGIVQQLAQLRAKARAEKAKQAVQAQATKVAARWAIRAALPWILAGIGILLLAIGIPVLFTTLFSSGALPSV